MQLYVMEKFCDFFTLRPSDLKTILTYVLTTFVLAFICMYCTKKRYVYCLCINYIYFFFAYYIYNTIFLFLHKSYTTHNIISQD